MMAAEALGKYGITVNAVMPGPVPTKHNSAYLAQDATRTELCGRIPMGSYGDPAYIADGVAYFLGEKACWTTGVLLPRRRRLPRQVTPQHHLQKKPRRVCAAHGANKAKIIFSGGMYVGKNTSQPANVRTARHWRAVSALQRAAIPSNENPAQRFSFESVREKGTGIRSFFAHAFTYPTYQNAAANTA